MEKRRSHADFTGDGCDKSRRPSDGSVQPGQEHLEQEKRVRREIANSNERRRMQSINAGFESLRILLPPVQDGEKMSKATILQLTAEYINSLVNRVSLLENEVAIYRQSTGIQPTTILPEFPADFGLSRRRKSNENKKRAGFNRSRRRRLDPERQCDVSRSDIARSSPATDIHHTSPSNSFNSSISVSPPSPIPDGTSSTSARLEHLVMAIEQIEGGRAIYGSGNESQDESLSAGDQSPPLSTETYWQSPQDGFHSCTFSDVHSANLKPVTFTDVLMLTPVSDAPSITVPLNDADPNHLNTTDYPVVAKLLNRPIPHKYLHRPQVVVNSSH